MQGTFNEGGSIYQGVVSFQSQAVFKVSKRSRTSQVQGFSAATSRPSEVYLAKVLGYVQTRGVGTALGSKALYSLGSAAGQATPVDHCHAEASVQK